MELLNNLFSDKKMVRLIIILFVVILTICLYLIWSPRVTLEISKYTAYDSETKLRNMAIYYFRTIRTLANSTSEEDLTTLEDLIDTKYLNYCDENVDDVIKILKQSSISNNFTNINICSFDEKVIYSATLNTNSGKKQVNIIEEFPYDYTIALGSFVDYSNLYIATTKNNVVFRLSYVYTDLNYVSYMLEVENGTQNIVSIDTSLSTNVYVTLDDGSKVYLNNGYGTKLLSNMLPNATASKELMFYIPVASEAKAVSLNINNVIINGTSQSISIDL